MLQSSGGMSLVRQLRLWCNCPDSCGSMHCAEAAVGSAGVLGTLLSDDEAGRAKLTRLAMSVGKVSILFYYLQTTCLCTYCSILQP